MNPLLVLTLLFTQLQPLTWADFKAKPYTKDDALTVSRIDIISFETDGKITWDVSAVFDSDSSFTRTADLKILNHERIHFDITRYYAGKIKQFLIRYQGCSVLKSKSVEMVIDRYVTEWKQFEARYDKETVHSINQYEQKKWNIKIQKLLQ